MKKKPQTVRQPQKAKSKKPLPESKVLEQKKPPVKEPVAVVVKPKKPDIKIDKVVLEALCSYQAPLSEIADVLKTTQKTIREFVKREYKQEWKEFFKEKSAIGKSKLRETRFNLAKKSPEMAKYLSEKYLSEEENEQLQEAIDRMTPKKKKFADKLLECQDQTKAAEFAGYKGKNVRITASKLVKDKWITEYMRLKQEETARRLDMSREKYLSKLNDIVEDDPFSKNKIAAMRVIGDWEGYNAPAKTQQLGKDGQPVDPPGSQPLDLSVYSLEELKTLQTLLSKQKKPDDQQQSNNS